MAYMHLWVMLCLAHKIPGALGQAPQQDSTQDDQLSAQAHHLAFQRCATLPPQTQTTFSMMLRARPLPTENSVFVDSIRHRAPFRCNCKARSMQARPRCDTFVITLVMALSGGIVGALTP